MSKARKPMRVKSHQLTVGIDIGKYHHVAVGLAGDGRFTKPMKLPNTREGYEQLLLRIMAWKKEYGADEVLVGMESTGHYWEVPARWLTAHSIPVVQVNALHTKRAKEIEDNTPGKTDPKDARIIAQLVAWGKYLDCHLPDGAVAELRQFVRQRSTLTNELTEKRNYLRYLLDCVFPELFTVFKKSSGKTLLHLLALCPSPHELIGADQADVARTLRQHCPTGAAKRLDRVYALARITVGIAPARHAYAVAIRRTATRILALREEKAEVEQQMTKLLIELPEAGSLLSVKGIGPVSAAIIVGETGGLHRFGHAEEVIKLAGLNLFEVSSGTHKGTVRISKRGRPLLRQILFVLATIQAKKGMPFHACYEELLNKKMPRVKALIAVARKMVRVLFALVRDGRCYQDEKPAALKMGRSSRYP